ncbi:zinc-dependent metalloprotease [Mycolicibacterium brumae]|uniref:Hydrolase n=1 Tax=Mycolicibacterium brumae TaxID=85968 RepID=A0A2G5P6Q7_9MYCO|nr:zinc-dependent metalloprotease [Mycolicibacterium brumae]MCV7193776.1 zinc-dependent metalloprotease [Mycolicibacterium brumae]PIB74032.1 hydrolase [Mycolicibacterium brumae]UWW07327.1 zinc-dependent metalloprotease [Mycolicibacterium brumae]
MLDWQFAADLGARLARPGPPMSDYTRDQAIAVLADCALRAEPLVREISRLTAGQDAPEAAIVDRPDWIRAAAAGMRVLMSAATGPAEPEPEPSGLLGRAGALASTLAGRAAGAQTGAVLAFVSSGILGQFDPFGADGPRLLLVYPNIVAVERQLRVPPADFRLWVCLHEVTHRVQFSANPWLSDYMASAVGVLTGENEEQFSDLLTRVSAFARNREEGMVGLLRATMAEPQRKALDQMLVLGTLLEGHADHVMDAVGPSVVPSVHTIRARFNSRRERKHSPLQRLLRAVLGLDAKLAQYTRGKAFVDNVVGRVGMDRFNTIWTGPDTLPLPPEVDHPQRWIDRVL